MAVLPLHVGNQAHPAGVAAALKLGGEEGVHNPLGQIVPDDPGAQRQHIGVVVAAAQLGGQGLAAQGAADALYLVGRDGDADAGGTDDNAFFALAGGYRLSGGAAENGVVAALGAVRAEVLAGDALGGELGLDVLLQRVAAVVRRDCNHGDSSC